MTEPQHCKNFISGEWMEGGGVLVVRTDPSDTRQVVATFNAGTRADAISAIESARRAFPAWSAMPAPERGRILRKAAAICRTNLASIGRRMVVEAGKTVKAAQGEVLKGILEIEYFDGEGLRPNGRVIPSEAGGTFTYTRRLPLGVVALITPWNFPWAVPWWKIAAALISGDTVVWKPSPHTPWTSCAIVEALKAAGLPDGVLNLVHGNEVVGNEFVMNDYVDAISFTGSTKVGQKINLAAAKRIIPIRVQCELGGKNAVLVMDDANLDLATRSIVDGAFGSAGQRCTATGRVIVHRAVADQLTKRILHAAREYRIGLPSNPETEMGPLVSAEHHARVMGMIQDASKDMCQLLTGGNRPAQDELANGHFILPTVFSVGPMHTLFHEEVFGPVLAITIANDFENGLELVNRSNFGLAASIFTQDARLMDEFTRRAEVGMVHLNESTAGGEAQLPFGGFKATAIGLREMGPDATQFYTREVTVFDSRGGASQAATK